MIARNAVWRMSDFIEFMNSSRKKVLSIQLKVFGEEQIIVVLTSGTWIQNY